MSNIPVTPGSGAIVSTETISGVDYQRIKVIGAETGSTSVMGVNPDRSINVSVVGTVSTTFAGTVTTISPPTSLISGVTSIITSTNQTSVVTTAPSAQRNYITQVLITNGAAAGTFVDIMDGSNVLYSGFAAATGGFSLSFPTPLKQANTVTSVDVRPRVQASIIAAISGYTAA